MLWPHWIWKKVGCCGHYQLSTTQSAQVHSTAVISNRDTSTCTTLDFWTQPIARWLGPKHLCSTDTSVTHKLLLTLQKLIMITGNQRISTLINICLKIHTPQKPKTNVFNPFTAMPSVGKWPIKAPNLKPLRLFAPFPWARQRISIKMHSTESRFVTGPSNILFAGIYVCNFQPRNFTGWGSEGVKTEEACCMKAVKKMFWYLKAKPWVQHFVLFW